VLVLPDNVAFIKLDPESFEVRNVKTFIVLFIGSFNYNFLLAVINLNAIDFFRPFQFAYSPLKTICSVFANENRLDN